jgi:hypothetical protein
MSSLNTTQSAEQLDVELHLSRSRPALLLQGSAVILQGLQSGLSHGNEGPVRRTPLPLPMQVCCSRAVDLHQERPQ